MPRDQGELGDELALVDVLDTRVSGVAPSRGESRTKLTRSVPQTPQALTLTRTSSSRSSGRGASTTENSRGLEYLVLCGGFVSPGFAPQFDTKTAQHRVIRASR